MTTPGPPPAQRGPGLRRRVTVAFALGALVLSACLATLTYELARSYLLRQRESTLVSQAYVNARAVRQTLSGPDPDIPDLLSAVETPNLSRALLSYQGRWFGASVAVGQESLPEGLRREVLDGVPARQRFALDGRRQLSVGVPIVSVGAAYFEVFDMEVLASTLRVLGNSLVAGAAITTLLGAAVGRWASGRLMQPLANASQAAAAVAAGRFDVRLDTSPDADLAVLADSFNSMTDALGERIEREARFASSVSHELRSPLTTLSASVEVLQARRHEMGERAQRALDLLRSDLRRFERLVGDLVEISRLDAGAEQLELEVLAVGTLVEQSLQRSMRPNVAVEVRPRARGVEVRADRRRMGRVLANLVENAETHGRGVARVTVDREGWAARIGVEDRGPGVAPEERQRIFERFVRGEEGRHRGEGDGSGLGLSLVSEHVRLHGGRTWVEEAPGGGARFVVELPVARGGPTVP